jgi:hypothetical protein
VFHNRCLVVNVRLRLTEIIGKGLSPISVACGEEFRVKRIHAGDCDGSKPACQGQILEEVRGILRAPLQVANGGGVSAVDASVDPFPL